MKIYSDFQIMWNNSTIEKLKSNSIHHTNQTENPKSIVIKKIKNLMNEWQIQPEKQSPILQNSPLQNWNPEPQENPSHIHLQH